MSERGRAEVRVHVAARTGPREQERRYTTARGDTVQYFHVLGFAAGWRRNRSLATTLETAVERDRF